MFVNRSLSQKIILVYLVLSFIIITSGLDFSLIPASFFVVWLIHLIRNTNRGLLIRYIFVLLMSLQYAFGSTLSYAFDDVSVYKMVLPANEYFSYVFPSILLFSLGLFYKAEKTDEDKAFFQVYEMFKKIKVQGKTLEVIMLFSILLEIFPLPIPQSLDFVMYILFYLKYAYVCYHLITKPKISYTLIALPIMFLIYKSIITAMFHDLVSWSIFWGMSYCIRFKPSLKIKIIAALSFFIVLITIQLTKGEYREKAWGLESGRGQAGVDVYQDIFKKETSTGLFDNTKLTANIVRINQGWILCKVLDYVPHYEKYAGFELIYKYIEAAFLPRVLAPNKLNAGDKELFGKYTGLKLGESTSMGLGFPADAWISFGKIGGWLMIFLYGILISLTLKYFERLIYKFPYLYFFLPVIYFYPIRPDCETQTSFGHLIKTLIMITFLAYRVFPKMKLKTIAN